MRRDWFDKFTQVALGGLLIGCAFALVGPSPVWAVVCVIVGVAMLSLAFAGG